MIFYLTLTACLAAVAVYGLCLWLFPFSIITFVLGIFVCSWLVNLFHELGHLLAYRLLKLEWKRMVISCFVFEKGQGLRIDRQQKLYAASCTCAYSPQVPYQHYCIALLSGGGLCLFLALGAFLGCCFASGGLQAFLLCFGAVCTLNALANLLPPFSADRLLLRQIKEERENPQ